MTESPSSSSLADFIPLAEDDDPEDVALALETAGALGGRGDMREALRWLRKASEAADDAGRDKRSLALARAAADIATRLASIPPPPVSVPQSLGPDDVVAAAAALPEPELDEEPEFEEQETTPAELETKASEPETKAPEPEAKAPERSAMTTERPPKRPLPPSARRTSLLPAVPSALTGASAPSAPKAQSLPSRPSVTPPPPAATPAAPSVTRSMSARPPSRSSVTPPPPAAATAEARATRPPPKPSLTPPPPAVSAATVAKAPKPVLGSTQSLLGPAGHDAVERLLREGRAANVFVKRSARDSSLYVMRTGSERAGALRAVIILLEEDPEFFEGAV